MGGYLDTNGTFTSIVDPLGTTYAAQGVNNAGQTVGQYLASGKEHGFLDTNGTFATIDDQGAGPGGTWAQGINDAGDIVGYYTTASGGTYGFLATPDVTTDGAPLPVMGGTLPGCTVAVGWAGPPPRQAAEIPRWEVASSAPAPCAPATGAMPIADTRPANPAAQPWNG